MSKQPEERVLVAYMGEDANQQSISGRPRVLDSFVLPNPSTGETCTITRASADCAQHSIALTRNTHVHTHTHTHTHTQTHTHTHTHTHTRTHTHTHTHTHIHTHTHKHTHTQTHTHTRSHTHIHTRTTTHLPGGALYLT